MDAIPDKAAPAQLAVRPSRARRIDLAFLVQVLRRQKGLIGLVLASGLIVTLLGLLVVTPRYIATASILLDPRQQRVFNPDSVQQGFNDDVYVVESQLELLRSKRIATRVLKELGLRGVAPSGDSRPRTSSSWPSIGEATSKNIVLADASPAAASLQNPPDAKPRQAEEVFSPDKVERFLRGLTVERKGRSYIVDVSYTDISGERAAKIANAFVNAYVTDQLEGKFQVTRGATLWLKERVREIGHELDDVEQRRQKFRADRQLIAVGDLTLLEKEISEYTQQLISARAHVAEAEARLDQVRALANDPQQVLSLDVALQSTVISDYRRQAAEIQRRIGEKISRYGDQHADVVSAKAELDNLNKEVEREIKRIVESMQLTYTAATGKVKLLEDGLQKLKDSFVKFGEYQIKLGEFNREIDVSRDLYTNLLRRYKETSAQEKLQSADVRVVAYAIAPPHPTYPKKVLVLLLTSVGWLGLGVGLGLMRELNHSVLRSRTDVEDALGVECVATLPVVDLTAGGVGEERQQNLSGPVHWRVDEDLDGVFSQSIFGLKRWAEGFDGRGSRVVLVVAAHPAEGCSTVAAQLALYAANTGTRAVLVDADLRSHAISDVLAPAAKCTLADVVMKGADPKSAVVQLPGQTMCLCPAPADGKWRPLDVLGARAMEGFFGALRDEFDLIIVDTPPMAAYVDATALIDHADCVLVVVKAGQTQESDALDVLRRLDVDSELAFGVVLNMATPTLKD